MNVFVSLAPYCVYAPVEIPGRDVFESDDGSIDRHPEGTLAPTTDVVDKKSLCSFLTIDIHTEVGFHRATRSSICNFPSYQRIYARGKRPSRIAKKTWKYTTLLDALDLEHIETATNRRHLWYDDTLYRYGLYVNDAD